MALGSWRNIEDIKVVHSVHEAVVLNSSITDIASGQKVNLGEGLAIAEPQQFFVMTGGQPKRRQLATQQ